MTACPELLLYDDEHVVGGLQFPGVARVIEGLVGVVRRPPAKLRTRLSSVHDHLPKTRQPGQALPPDSYAGNPLLDANRNDSILSYAARWRRGSRPQVRVVLLNREPAVVGGAGFVEVAPACGS